MRCVHCGTELRNVSNYCLKCGQPVNAMECYIAEMKLSGKGLTRKTDKESLDRIIALTRKIFERTHINPDLKYEVRSFFEAYLPRITSVLSGFRSLKNYKGDKEQMADVRDNLTEVLNSTEEAFDIMYRELCENDIMELQVNIAALKAQIAKDGLLDSDFVIKE